MMVRRAILAASLLAAAFLAVPILGPAALWAQAMGTFPQVSESTGERELGAFVQAYPDRLTGPELRDGDWAVRLGSRWFYWAHGRILSEEQRSAWASYAAYRFYRYPVGALPPLPQLDAQSIARLQAIVQQSQAKPPRRSEVFLETLLGAGSPEQTRSNLVTVSFLGFAVQIHSVAASALEKVAAECALLVKSDPEASAFFAGLHEIDGFNYREVAGTATRSYHGYGLALDLIPKSYGGRPVYWLWAMQAGEPWWAIPYDRRWMVPASVVTAFENNGFVWGGKWLFFDMMHFEYRPELLLLARQSGAP